MLSEGRSVALSQGSHVRLFCCSALFEILFGGSKDISLPLGSEVLFAHIALCQILIAMRLVVG